MIYKDTADAKIIPDFMLKHLKDAGKILAGEDEEGEKFDRYLDGGTVYSGDIDQDPKGNNPAARKMLWVKNTIGRPCFGSRPMQRRNIILSDNHIKKARTIGEGNISLGIRTAIDAFTIKRDC